MSDGIVYRPEADSRKINSRDDFELCYLRHKYLRKANVNPTAEDMRPYKAIATHMAKNTFFTYRNLFGTVGFDKEDIISIAQIQLVSFLGLFSLERLPDKYKEFVDAHFYAYLKDPDEFALLDKNRANCTLFLKQRMEDLVRVCRQKARNIKGLPTEEYFFYYGPNPPPAVLRDLIDNYERLGFKKLDTAVYKSIRKKVRVEEGPVFSLKGNYYVAVPIEQKTLSISDFSGAGLDPRDTIHHMNPEELFCAVESNNHWEMKHEEFNRKGRFYKTRILKQFIEENKKKPEFKEEVKAARKMLKTIGA